MFPCAPGSGLRPSSKFTPKPSSQQPSLSPKAIGPRPCPRQALDRSKVPREPSGRERQRQCNTGAATENTHTHSPEDRRPGAPRSHSRKLRSWCLVRGAYNIPEVICHMSHTHRHTHIIYLYMDYNIVSIGYHICIIADVRSCRVN